MSKPIILPMVPAATDPLAESKPDSDTFSASDRVGTQVASELKADVFVPPNGGLKAWLCVLGGFCCQFCSFGFVNACGIFQLYYETDLLPNHSSSSLTWIVTIQIFLMFFFGPVIGVLVDVVGARRIVAAAAFLALLGVCMLSLCTQYWQIMLSQGICFGIGAAGLFLPAMVATGQWFTTRRGLAMGIVASGSSLGGTIFPIMIPRLINAQGFPAAVRWSALLLGVLLVIAVCTVTGPLPPKGRKKQPSSGISAFKSLPWIFFSIGCFFIVWGLFAPFNYLPLMATQNGMSESLAIYTLSIANAASIFGRIIPGYLSDKMGQLNLMFFVGTLSGTSILFFWLPLSFFPSNAGIIVFSAFYGVVSGGFVSLMTPCVVTLCDGKVEELGAKLGAFMVVIALASLTGLPILGAIRDSEGDESFKGMIIFAGVVMTVGGLFIAAARVSRNGFKMVKV